MIFQRGQAWGFDLLIGTIIFVSGILFFYFYSLNYAGENQIDFLELEEEATQVSSILVTEGFPKDWTEINYIRIGLYSDGKINDTKLSNFNSLSQSNYQSVRSSFQIRNNFYVYFPKNVTIQGANVSTIGLVPTDSENLVKSNRVVVYNNSIVNMEVYVWN